jgi:hypothetical protein
MASRTAFKNDDAAVVVGQMHVVLDTALNVNDSGQRYIDPGEAKDAGNTHFWIKVDSFST